MQATQKGKTVRAAFSREEIWACLECTGDGEQHSVVHMAVNGSGKLRVVAFDGKRSVQADAPAKNVSTFSVVLDAAHLEKGRAALKTGESLVLEITESGKVKDLLIVDAKTGDTICPLGWHRQIEDAPISMGDIVDGIRVPDDANYTGSWCAFDPARALRLMERVRVAADNPITWYPPAEPRAPFSFETTSKDGTRWRGSILTEKVLGPGAEADDPPDADEDAPGRDDRQTRLDLAERADKPREEASSEGDDTAIVGDDYAERVKAQQARAEDDLPNPGEQEPELATKKRGAKARVKNRSQATN